MASMMGSLKSWFLLLVLLAGLGFGGLWWMRNRFEVKGIDISHYQGTIDWSELSQQDIDFVFVKATEGTSLVDAQFDAHWAGAKEAGIARGAYHFFHPDLDGAAQAEHFLSHVDYEKGDLPPVLDLELTDEASAARIQRESLEWCKAVEAAWGVKPIVYTLPHYANSYLDSKLKRYPLWVVDVAWLPWPRDAEGWPKWTFWQRSHHGSMPGIEGDVDLNVFNGSAVEFGLLRKR